MTFSVLILMFFSVTPCDGDQIKTAWEQQNVSELRRWFRSASSESDRMLALYRLYPLTEDGTLLRNIPRSLPESASARDHAVLAALWSYRINEDKTLLISAGLRIDGLLKKALARDPDDPFYLLVEGQGLLYKPRMFGGSKSKALRFFRKLKENLTRNSSCGMSPFEADIWTWYTLEKMGDTSADGLRTRLLRQSLPSIYREFLQSPP